MLRAISPRTSVQEYSLPEDKENPTVFLIRPLTGEEYLDALRETAIGGRISASVVELVRRGLTGWRNLADAEFSDNMQDNIDVLAMETLVAVGTRIRQISELSNEDKKKSLSPSSCSSSAAGLTAAE